MSSNVTEVQLPNPLTPLSFFPPSLAFSISVSSYVTIGTLSVMLWDIINNMRDEYILIKRHKINFSAIIYYISRLSNLAYFITQALFQTFPLGKCARTWKMFSYLTAVILPSTSLLFFLRLRALYRDHRTIIVFFFLLWLAVCGGSAMVILGTSGENIGLTDYCINGGIKQYVSFGGLVIVVHDTLVFFAISWRLMGISLPQERGFIESLKVMVSGKNLPAFSKAFLKDGQVYYLITIGFGIITTSVLYMDFLPLVYRGILGNPNLMLMNVLACRVYRNTKLGLYQDSQTTIISHAVKKLSPTTISSSERDELELPVVRDRDGFSRFRVSGFRVDESCSSTTCETPDHRDTIPLRMV